MEPNPFSPQYFAEMAELEATHPWTRSMRLLTLALIEREKPAGVRRVLDAGCGTGLLLDQWLASGSAHLGIGIDFAADAIGWAGRRTRGVWVLGSAADLPFRPCSFDAIHSADVLQHLSLEESARALDSFVRLLVPGGIVALRVRAPRILRREPDFDFSHSFSPVYLKAELHRRGLEPVFVSHVNALPSLWAEIRGLFQRLAQNTAVKGIQAHDRDTGPKQMLLGRYLSVERWWLKSIRIPLPFGHTVICIARKINTI